MGRVLGNENRNNNNHNEYIDLNGNDYNRNDLDYIFFGEKALGLNYLKRDLCRDWVLPVLLNLCCIGNCNFLPDYYTQPVVDFFGRLHSLDHIKSDIAQGRIGVLVKDGEIIGTGSRTDHHITRVYVLPEYQGLGFGSMIMDALEKEIFKSYEFCELDASLPACIFYENRGYQTVKHVKYDIGGGKCMIYEIMRKYNDK